ncbi:MULTISPECIES: NAD-dependent epimerase/dehydratase family protein [Acidobacterium]|uniref:Surface polysaccharide biosynthesis protein n=1 Tax=Acidobacterium capsulatum (strain ATCC 51196 / DSM 11244 / BCRC 80197 / JCM 7670 / NBRC 15755 / NCIMB 13165 / 161) TaxID=240015 RepID=C1F1T2_ACIC5|nr:MULTISPECIES: NAD-dependent epimerase/dehydratase family protein [Acidobacterium]ACO34637.1 surface polysaccharide biosynthesis protein [Acidobacterium capsulatum ATCC 51196]HCT59993.1 hypothetical protein [Acidobacterium sp.]
MADSHVFAVTGATGYVGSAIVKALQAHGTVIPLSRRTPSQAGIFWSLESEQDITAQFRDKGISCLVHAAWDMTAVKAAEVQRTNVEGSLRLLQMAAAAGISRIVFISTISAFPGARSLYGKSKLQVEAAVAAMGGLILRPGLVYGPGGQDEDSGGIFQAIEKQVKSSSRIPVIGDGKAPQFLVPVQTLAQIVAGAARGKLDAPAGQPITIANPQPWRFRDLVHSIARRHGRRVALLPIPWRLLYMGLRSGEILGLHMPFRSDSVISFVHQDPSPDFSALQTLGIFVPPYRG